MNAGEAAEIRAPGPSPMNADEVTETEVRTGRLAPMNADEVRAGRLGRCTLAKWSRPKVRTGRLAPMNADEMAETEGPGTAPGPMNWRRDA